MNKSGGVECLLWCWGIAALLGFFAAILLWTLGDWTFMQGAFGGFIVTLVLGAVLTISMCRAPNPGPVSNGQGGTTGSGASAYVASGLVSPAKTGAAGSTAAGSAASSASASGAGASVSAAGASGSSDGAAAAAPAPAAAAATPASAPAATPAPAPAAAAAPAATPAASPTDAPAPAAAAAPAATPAASPTDAPAPAAEGPGTRPEALSGPRGGEADDLKRIKGVGPKMEKMCNELGFYHFDQIAAWTPEEVAWVDQNLQGFKGRVTRDTWVDQAKLLAAGGETEFSKKVDGGDVY